MLQCDLINWLIVDMVKFMARHTTLKPCGLKWQRLLFLLLRAVVRTVVGACNLQYQALVVWKTAQRQHKNNARR